MLNRVMRLNRNPAARGFLVRVLEQVGEPCETTGTLTFRTIAISHHNTKKSALLAYERMRREHIIGVEGVRQP